MEFNWFRQISFDLFQFVVGESYDSISDWSYRIYWQKIDSKATCRLHSKRMTLNLGRLIQRLPIWLEFLF